MKSRCVPFLLAALLCLLSFSGVYAIGADDDYFDIKAPSTFLYTNKLVYVPGETMMLNYNANGSLNGFPFDIQFNSFFFYLENLETGQKLYQPDNTTTVSDIFAYDANPGSNTYFEYIVPTDNYQWFGPSGIYGPSWPVPSQPGSYRWVMELRDRYGLYVSSVGYAPFTVVSSIQSLDSNITTDTTLTNDKAYILSALIHVLNNATLTIEPGTILMGDGVESGVVITQGAKIHAVGTARRPIVFTSVNDVGERLPGDWFGIAIAGYAPINVVNGGGGTAVVEGIDDVVYGGNDPDDNSGIMRYVRIEFAGYKFTPTKEANGLYLCGVGRGTVLEYLHFNQNSDDNIEFFGGTAQVKYIYCTGGNDDQFDWTEGFQGKAQFVIVQVYKNSGGNRGIEADNYEYGFDNTPRSKPTIYNMTIIGPQQNYGDGEGKADHGIRFRRGTAGQLFNFIIIGYGQDAIRMDEDVSTPAQANSGELDFNNAILFNNGVFGADGKGCYNNTTTANWMATKDKVFCTNPGDDVVMNPRLVDPYNEITPDYRPGYMSPALRIDIVKQPPDDGFFEPVHFIGGMSPNYNWLAGGWTYVTPW